jgi:hypothetical protein
LLLHLSYVHILSWSVQIQAYPFQHYSSPIVLDTYLLQKHKHFLLLVSFVISVYYEPMDEKSPISLSSNNISFPISFQLFTLYKYTDLLFA